jgi:hypothetical protein
MLIGSVHDLEPPASPVLTLLITFCDHVAGFGERVLSGDLKARVRLPFRVFDEAARGPDVEVVQSRMGLVLGRVVRLVGRMSGARCTAFIVPPLEVVTLAQSSGNPTHADIQQRGAGFLMTERA